MLTIKITRHVVKFEDKQNHNPPVQVAKWTADVRVKGKSRVISSTSKANVLSLIEREIDSAYGNEIGGNPPTNG